MKKYSEVYVEQLKQNGASHIAFWSYDRFPYCVASGVNKVEITDTCKVRARAIDYQGVVSPDFMTENLAYGIQTFNKLEALENEYESRLTALRNEYKEKALVIAPFLKNFTYYK